MVFSTSKVNGFTSKQQVFFRGENQPLVVSQKQEDDKYIKIK